MVENKLLSHPKKCPCGNSFDLCPDNDHSKCLDSHSWKCTRCSYTQSLRKNSICEKSKLSLRHILFLTFEWSSGSKAIFAAFRCGLHKLVVADWFSLLDTSCIPELSKIASAVESCELDVIKDLARNVAPISEPVLSTATNSTIKGTYFQHFQII